jgi:hypothetical protein
MCDPFNTSTEAARWDEREDLGPFMAEHYATNAQHEFDRALAAPFPDQQRISHIRRLLGYYHGLAALIRLPGDSDFEDAIVVKAEEIAAGEDTVFVHPDRAALMATDDDDEITTCSRFCSPESSAESISREDDLDGHVNDQQQQHIDRDPGHRLHQQVPQQQIHQQQIHQQQIHQQQIHQQQLFQQQLFQQQHFQQQHFQQRLVQ